ncbi:5278_t:CDS:1, partial [Acaulospora morrowiae]
VYIKLMSDCWDHDPRNRPKASELSRMLGDWVIAICDDPNPSLLSEQFDAAEEKKFADLESNSFTRPEIHPQAIYTSRPLNFNKSLCMI